MFAELGSAATALRACLRAYPEPPPDPVSTDEEFWNLAEQGGVAALVARQLGARSQRSDRVLLQQTATELLVRATTDWVLGVLGGAQIAAVPLKGPYLADRLYEESVCRPTSDVDLLLAQKDLAVALERLEAAGAETGDPEDRREHHHVQLYRRGMLVELHFRATSNFGSLVASEPLIVRAHGMANCVLRLEPVDELIFLAVHAAAHRLQRDLWLLDLKMYCRKEPPDWEALEARARDWKVLRSSSAAFVAASRRTGLDISAMNPVWRKQGELALRLLPRRLTSGPAPTRRLAWNNGLAQLVLADSLGSGARILRQKLRRLATWIGPHQA